jgi:hypothetical protein
MYRRAVGRRGTDLIAEIEREAVDGNGSIAAALRKCLVLGGQLQSAELREWASRELNGYGDDDELPAYRVVPAALRIDGADLAKRVTGQGISRFQLPDFAQDDVREELRFDYGIGKIEKLIDGASSGGLSFGIPGGADLAAYMTSQVEFTSIDRIYKTTHVTELEGIVDAVRVRLVELVSELRAGTVDGAIAPEVASQAVDVAVHGKRNRVTVVNAGGPVEVTPKSEGWGWKLWALIGGVASILGLVLAVVVMF